MIGGLWLDPLLNVSSAKSHHAWKLITSSSGDQLQDVLSAKGPYTWMLVNSGDGNPCLNVLCVKWSSYPNVWNWIGWVAFLHLEYSGMDPHHH